MAKITFDVTDEDGVTTRILAGQADLIAMERKFDVPVSALSENPRMEYISFVAWNAAKRQGITKMDFDTWIGKNELEELPDSGN